MNYIMYMSAEQHVRLLYATAKFARLMKYGWTEMNKMDDDDLISDIFQGEYFIKNIQPSIGADDGVVSLAIDSVGLSSSGVKSCTNIVVTVHSLPKHIRTLAAAQLIAAVIPKEYKKMNKMFLRTYNVLACGYFAVCVCACCSIRSRCR